MEEIRSGNSFYEVVDLYIPEKSVKCEMVEGETLEERITAFAQRIAKVESENRQLKRFLEEAEHKLDAITMIERSIREQTDDGEIQY